MQDVLFGRAPPFNGEGAGEGVEEGVEERVAAAERWSRSQEDMLTELETTVHALVAAARGPSEGLSGGLSRGTGAAALADGGLTHPLNSNSPLSNGFTFAEIFAGIGGELLAGCDAS